MLKLQNFFDFMEESFDYLLVLDGDGNVMYASEEIVSDGFPGVGPLVGRSIEELLTSSSIDTIRSAMIQAKAGTRGVVVLSTEEDGSSTIPLKAGHFIAEIGDVYPLFGNRLEGLVKGDGWEKDEDKMPGFVRFLRSHGVHQLALNRMAPVGRGKKEFDSLPSDQQYLVCLRDSYLATVETDFEFKIKPIVDWARKILNPTSQSHGCYQCGAGWSHISIDPSGNVYACDRFSFDPDWVSGNIRKQKILEILNESKMTACRTRMERISACKSCKVAYVCGGSCAVTSHYRHGTIDTPGHECGNMRDFIPWLSARLSSKPDERFAIQSMILGVEPSVLLHELKTAQTATVYSG